MESPNGPAGWHHVPLLSAVLPAHLPRAPTSSMKTLNTAGHPSPSGHGSPPPSVCDRPTRSSSPPVKPASPQIRKEIFCRDECTKMVLEVLSKPVSPDSVIPSRRVPRQRPHSGPHRRTDGRMDAPRWGSDGIWGVGVGADPTVTAVAAKDGDIPVLRPPFILPYRVSSPKSRGGRSLPVPPWPRFPPCPPPAPPSRFPGLTRPFLSRSPPPTYSPSGKSPLSHCGQRGGRGTWGCGAEPGWGGQALPGPSARGSGNTVAMLPEDRKEGSPRFGKLHFPVGLWINSPKKRLAKMSRRWPSAGSVRSTSSDTASRGSETVELRPPGKTKPSRHKRLSNLFHRSGAGTGAASAGGRWASEKKLAELVDPVPEVLVGGENPPGQRQLPGILKIFGGDISRGANYKSVLATPRSTARQLVREALERYGLAPEEGTSGEYVLCDVVGRPGGPGGAWQVEHLRPVGDGERPLVLQDVWKPKTGCSRRFEIRRRQEVERACEGEDAETPGVNAQSRRLQKSRSRAASGGPAPPKDRADNLSLRRSISDMNLSTKRRRERKTVLSVAGGEAAAPPTDEGPPETPLPGEGAAGEEEAGEGAGLEQLSQCLIQPPQQHPYFLLLQGYGKQDFVIYVMTRPQHVFGRPERRGGPERAGGCLVDTFLNAPDILPRHCLVRAADGGGPEPHSAPPSATVRPFRGAPVTHNGAPLLRQAPLHPGDLLGLGQHFLFLYKDPRGAEGGRPPPWLPPAGPSPGLGGALGCPGCGRSPQERQEALRNLLESPRPELRFRPQEEEVLLREIVRLPEGFGGSGGAGGGGGVGALAPAFLLGLCLEHAARALPPERFPATLSRVALLVKETVWEKIKEIGDRQPENQQDAAPAAPSVEAVMADLRPLMLWLANATELLNLAQGRVLELEKELELEGPCQELTGDLETCDEAMGVLDEVIMSTFQQSVYYLTKTLYSALPALLESNPFSGAGEPSAAQDLASVPEGVRPTLAVYQAALELTRDCQLHPDLVSQTFGYLFFFSNASLFNTLMEKGSAGPFFQWWRAVRIRTNLDLVLEWLTGLGLGDIAAEFFRKLSATANLLCTPRSCLGKATWPRLRAEYPALSPAQLHHLLRHYQLGLGQAPPPAWSPAPEERELAATGDIFESFSEHPPLLLPTQGFRLRPGEPVADEGLLRPLCRLRRLLWDLERGCLPANQRALGLEGGP